MEEEHAVELWIQPETWPPPPALLPNGEVDIAAVRDWVARYVFGDVDAGEWSQNRAFLQVLKQAVTNGLQQLRIDLQDQKKRDAEDSWTGEVLKDRCDLRLH